MYSANLCTCTTLEPYPRWLEARKQRIWPSIARGSPYLKKKIINIQHLGLEHWRSTNLTYLNMVLLITSINNFRPNWPTVISQFHSWSGWLNWEVPQKINHCMYINKIPFAIFLKSREDFIYSYYKLVITT